jgi:DNA helicase-2/ATP-dependent DNA helicase PcrA
VIEASNEEDEAIKIINEIRDLTERGYANTKILLSFIGANNQSQPIEEAFSKHQVPYHIENGTGSMTVWR